MMGMKPGTIRPGLEFVMIGLAWLHAYMYITSSRCRGIGASTPLYE